MMFNDKQRGTLKSAVAFVTVALLPLGSACALDEGSEDAELEEAEGGGHHGDDPELLLSGLEGAQGSTVGPDGALYVTEGTAGRILRVDPRNGRTRVFASGLPQQIPAVGIGGPVDVAFLGNTGYALVTLVGPDVGGTSVVGVYRIDSPTSSTLIADVGAFSQANPPGTDFFIPTGVQYALEVLRGDLLVSDGHHNRVLRVTRDGAISELRAFDNIVPTGLEVSGDRVYMAEAGPVPHLAADGAIVSFRRESSTVRDEASGAPFLVDVEFGRDDLYGLSQGFFPPGNPEGSPAAPDTGSLVKVRHNGNFSVVVDELDRPTSVEFIRNTAYVVTIPGDVWKIDCR